MPSPVNPFLAELADALEAALLDRGYLVSIGITREDPKRELDNVRALLDRRVDGLILLSSTALETIRRSAEETPPVVVIDHVPKAAGVMSVRVNNVSASAYAVQLLQDLGHTVIACLSGPEEVPTSQERIEGWRRQQISRGLPASDDLVSRGAYTPEGGAQAARALLESTNGRHGRPTALFIASDAQAIGALRSCSELGITVPDDLSIVSFDGTQIGKFTHPPLTAIKQPIETIVENAIDLLLAQIADPLKPPQQVEVGWLVSTGGSTAPRPVAAN
jgi:LacI family transcriptional regulator